MTTDEESAGSATPAPAPVPERRRRRRPGAAAGGPPPAGGGAVYGLGMIGALAYFAQTAETQRDWLLAFPKATVWPAILVYRMFVFLAR